MVKARANNIGERKARGIGLADLQGIKPRRSVF
jgi:hypothetical protein